MSDRETTFRSRLATVLHAFDSDDVAGRPGVYPGTPAAPICVRVTRVDIPFGDLVMLIFKFSLAAIPAMVLLLGVGIFVFAAITNGLGVR